MFDQDREKESDAEKLRAWLAGELRARPSRTRSCQVGDAPEPLVLPPVDQDDFLSWTVERLEHEVALTASVINAHQARLSHIASMLALRTDIWGDEQLRRTRWLSWKTGFTRAESQRICRVGDRMTQCPGLAAEHVAGRIGQDITATLTSICTPENETALIESTRITPPERIKTLARIFRRSHPDRHPDNLTNPTKPEQADEADEQAEKVEEFAARQPSELNFWWNHQTGRLQLRGDLNLEDGLLFTKAVDVETDRGHNEDPEYWKTLNRTQRYAHALGRLATAGLTNTGRPNVDRYKIILHTDITTLIPNHDTTPTPTASTQAGPHPGPAPSGAGQPWSDTGQPPPDGCSTWPEPASIRTGRGSPPPDTGSNPMNSTGFPAPTANWWAEHGGPPIPAKLLADLLFRQHQPFQVLYYTDKKVPLELGRTHRYATGHQRRVIHARQHSHCAWPTCTQPIHDIHHETEWNAGGVTDLNNLWGLCGPHHTALDHGATFTHNADGQLVAIDQHGVSHTHTPSSEPAPAHPAYLTHNTIINGDTPDLPNQGYEGHWDTYALDSIYLLWETAG